MRKQAGATAEQAVATAHQATLLAQQVELAAEQAASSARQAKVAADALQVQLAPELIPSGSVDVGLGKSEIMDLGPIEQEIRPVVVWVINAGHGMAILEKGRASALSLTSRGGFGVEHPPAIGGGRKGRLLLFAAAGIPQEPPVGERIEITIHYRGTIGGSRRLEFSITQVVEGRWTVELSE